MTPRLLSLLLLASAAGSVVPASDSAAARRNVRGRRGRRLSQFCGQCIWRGTIVCEARAQYLSNEYGDSTLEEYRESIMDACSSDDGESRGGTVPLDAYCGGCRWKNAGFDCDSRVAYLVGSYHLTDEKAKETLLEKGECVDPDYVAPIVVDIVASDRNETALNGIGPNANEPNASGPNATGSNANEPKDGSDATVTQNDDGRRPDGQGGDGDDNDGGRDEPSATDAESSGGDGRRDEPSATDDVADDGSSGGGDPVPIILFCGKCAWRKSELSCEEKARSLAGPNGLTLEQAKITILSDCFRNTDVAKVAEARGSDRDGIEGRVRTPDGDSAWMAVAVASIVLLLLGVAVLAIQRRQKRALREELLVSREEHRAELLRARVRVLTLETDLERGRGAANAMGGEEPPARAPAVAAAVPTTDPAGRASGGDVPDPPEADGGDAGDVPDPSGSADGTSPDDHVLGTDGGGLSAAGGAGTEPPETDESADRIEVEDPSDAAPSGNAEAKYAADRLTKPPEAKLLRGSTDITEEGTEESEGDSLQDVSTGEVDVDTEDPADATRGAEGPAPPENAETKHAADRPGGAPEARVPSDPADDAEEGAGGSGGEALGNVDAGGLAADDPEASGAAGPAGVGDGTGAAPDDDEGDEFAGARDVADRPDRPREDPR